MQRNMENSEVRSSGRELLSDLFPTGPLLVNWRELERQTANVRVARENEAAGAADAVGWWFEAGVVALS